MSRDRKCDCVACWLERCHRDGVDSYRYAGEVLRRIRDLGSDLFDQVPELSEHGAHGYLVEVSIHTPRMGDPTWAVVIDDYDGWSRVGDSLYDAAARAAVAMMRDAARAASDHRRPDPIGLCTARTL